MSGIGKVFLISPLFVVLEKKNESNPRAFLELLRKVLFNYPVRCDFTVIEHAHK